MTKLQVICAALTLTLTGGLTGCAQKPMRKESALDDGPLTVRNQRTQARTTHSEFKKLGDFVKEERHASRVKPKAHFDLPELANEDGLYSEVLKAYQTRDLDRAEFFTEELSQRFSESVFNDNALYLCGELKLALGMPAQALRDFEAVVQRYPSGNKRAAAMLGKAVAYRKLQLFQFAEKVFVDLKKEYPGSPEFYKSELEEQLVKTEKKAAL